MRAVVQRVTSGCVRVDGEVVGSIGRGLVVLLGIGQADDDQAVRYMVDKIINLRVFNDEDGRLNRSLMDTGGELLVVSQFTLYGDCRRGRRPGFSEAAVPEDGRAWYERFVSCVRAEGVVVKEGVFQAYMEVEIVNDGPVTLLIDSDKRF